MKYFFTFLIVAIGILPTMAQGNYWQDFNEASIILPQRSEVDITANEYRTLSLDFPALKTELKQAPMEFTAEAASNPLRLYLPLPNGEMELMEVVESPVMASELAAKFPSIKSFIARSATNKLTSARFDISPLGFNAIISTPEGKALISPYATEQTRFYLSYFVRNLEVDPSLIPALSCGYDDFDAEEVLDMEQQEALSEQTNLSFRNNDVVPLRTYRLALACTGEYGTAKGGTVEAVMATFNTAANLINQIFQLEFSARFELIPGNELLVFLNPSTDPYANANVGAALLGQNTAAITSIIPFSEFDIGHVFTMACTDVGGIAGGTICSANKARGVTCHYTGLNYIVTQVMAHEIGHQFSCGHSWNNCPPSLDQLSSGNAFEPGSGSTIMSYQGSCGSANNIPGPPGVYYNIGSLEDFIFFSRQGGGSTCGESIATENHQPVINLPYEDGFWIPLSTPFELDAPAEDIDGDVLTYCWEQYDLGPNVNLGEPILNSPLFRSHPPAEESNRIFPQMFKIVNNTFDIYEVLPDYERDLTFRITVRDNNPDFGGAVWEQVAFKSDGTSGPFSVLSPSVGGESWKVGEYQEVTWDVSNTDNNRVRCYYVNVKLSTDGGFTYPYTLLENTPNDGSAFVTVPDILSNEARIRVEAANNIFFDISDEDFSIEEATEPGYTVDLNPTALPLYCYPGDPINISINTGSILDYEGELSLELLGDLPANASAAFENTTLIPGESTNLIIEFDNFIGRDTFDLQVQATAEDLPAALRELRIIVLSNDFSALELLTPENGTSGIVLSTSFSWTDIDNASSYDIEIASKADFSAAHIIEVATGLTDPTYTPENLFEENTIYYWRVRPVNDCGPDSFLAPFAFQTSTVDCLPNEPLDLPIALPNNPTVRSSKIFVPNNGIISDVNLTDIEITYNPVNSLEISLISPAGTEVLLYDNNCLNTGLIALGFDDEALTGIQCPPISGNPTIPENPLSAFDGENTMGEWELKVRIVNSGFGGGSINSWNLEFCASITLAPPTLIRNETLVTPPGVQNTITYDYLEVDDPNSAAHELVYTILQAPQHGELFRTSDPEPLQAGEQFTQETINSWNLSYVHDGSEATTDNFHFIVENAEGGWIPAQTFNIEIDEGVTVGTADGHLDNIVSLFPNPAKDEVSITFEKAVEGDLMVQILNVQGQEVRQQQFAGAGNQVQLSTASLANGIYFMTIAIDGEKITRKLAIQR